MFHRTLRRTIKVTVKQKGKRLNYGSLEYKWFFNDFALWEPSHHAHYPEKMYALMITV